jgi:hypothetical protein
MLAGAASRWLEAAIVDQLPSKQQEQQSPVQAFLQVFDFSLLKYKERDLLLETFQQYRWATPQSQLMCTAACIFTVLCIPATAVHSVCLIASFYASPADTSCI